MATKTEKTFDCIAFKRKVQAEIYEEIKDMTSEQQVRYSNDAARTGPFARFFHHANTSAANTRKHATSAD